MTDGVGGSTAARELAELSTWPTQVLPITAEERAQRMAQARRLMAAAGADALLIGAGPSLRYFAGVSWGASERLVALLLTSAGTPVMIAPRFEEGSLRAELAIDVDLRTWEEHENPHCLVADALAAVRVLAVDPETAFHKVERLRRAAPSVRLIDATPVVHGCRQIKSTAELSLMRQAKAMTLEVQRRAARMLAPGITATAVRHFIEAAHRALGAPGNSFCIVQFGRSTAYPHGLPGESVLQEGDMVLIDTGCAVRGYSSDITRSYVYGEPGARQRDVWALEHAAQRAAFDAVRPGATCASIDAAARAVLEAAGLGPDYRLPGLPHRTGHGIGLAIHEPPYLVRGDETLLAPGMCFSDEPMIVLPDEFGIRLEDHFHVTEDGARWFTEPSPSIDRPFG